ncbi:MAG: glycoside hydrolase family 3 N-terminal domain-containing protein, partial [Candidatus Babeliales bacterium]
MKKIFFFLSILNVCLHAHQPVFMGQRFILTLPENKNFTNLKHWLAATKPSGVMLLASHVRNRKSARELISFLQHEAKKLGLTRLIVAIDWEGGIVSRPNEQAGFNSVPSPWLLASAGRSASFIAGMLIGQQLHEIGVTMNFAPSLDAFDNNNHILATRCFSSNPDTIFTCAQAYVQGLTAQGITPVIKHFPGLESATKDTHLSTATLSKNSCSLFDRMLHDGTPCVMATHAIAPQFGNTPITLSRTAIARLKKCNPHVICITDDFCMKALSANYALDDAAWKSLSCGYHLIIFSGTPEQQQKLIQSLQTRYEKLSTQQKKSWTAAQKFITHFKNTQKNIASCHLNEPAVAQHLAQRCITIPTPTPCMRKKTINLITTNLVKIRPPETWFISNNQSYLARCLEQHSVDVNEIILNPCSEKSTQQLSTFINNAQVNSSNPIVLQTFFYADGDWNNIQQKWLNILSPYQNNLIIISLGHPHERNFFQRANILNLGSFHQPLLTRAAQLLCTPYPQSGTDKLFAAKEKLLRGKRFGVLCHRCSVIHTNAIQRFLPDALYEWATACNDTTKLMALFSPEHGMQGLQQAGATVNSEQITQWGCPCYSLHGAHRQPTPQMLKNLDVILIDLQDVGVR